MIEKQVQFIELELIEVRETLEEDPDSALSQFRVQ